MKNGKASILNDASSRNNTPKHEAPLCARDWGIDVIIFIMGPEGGGGGGPDLQDPLAGSVLAMAVPNCNRTPMEFYMRTRLRYAHAVQVTISTCTHSSESLYINCFEFEAAAFFFSFFIAIYQ